MENCGVQPWVNMLILIRALRTIWKNSAEVPMPVRSQDRGVVSKAGVVEGSSAGAGARRGGGGLWGGRWGWGPGMARRGEKPIDGQPRVAHPPRAAERCRPYLARQPRGSRAGPGPPLAPSRPHGAGAEAELPGATPTLRAASPSSQDRAAQRPPKHASFPGFALD